MSQKETKSSDPKSEKSPLPRPYPVGVFKPDDMLDYLKFYFDAGNIAALHDALELLLGLGGAKKAPEWVLEGARQITEQRLKKGAPIGKGSSGNMAIYLTPPPPTCCGVMSVA
jgi:hypothetical protein